MESLLGDKEVWSTILEYWLKRAIVIDPTLGSPLNFYRRFQRLFSFGQLWNCYSVTSMCGWPYLSICLKGP
jgi:hypothetical protein